MPGVGLCSCRLWRRAWILGSLGLLFSCREAKRGLEPRRPKIEDDVGEPTEEAEETESERVVLVVESMLMVMMFLVEGGNVVCSVRSFCITQVFGMEKSYRKSRDGGWEGAGYYIQSCRNTLVISSSIITFQGEDAPRYSSIEPSSSDGCMNIHPY